MTSKQFTVFTTAVAVGFMALAAAAQSPKPSRDPATTEQPKIPVATPSEKEVVVLEIAFRDRWSRTKTRRSRIYFIRLLENWLERPAPRVPAEIR